MPTVLNATRPRPACQRFAGCAGKSLSVFVALLAWAQVTRLEYYKYTEQASRILSRPYTRPHHPEAIRRSETRLHTLKLF